MPEFFETRMGTRFYEHDVPRAIEQLKTIAQSLSVLMAIWMPQVKQKAQDNAIVVAATPRNIDEADAIWDALDDQVCSLEDLSQDRHLDVEEQKEYETVKAIRQRIADARNKEQP